MEALILAYNVYRNGLVWLLRSIENVQISLGGGLGWTRELFELGERATTHDKARNWRLGVKKIHNLDLSTKRIGSIAFL